MIKIRNAPKGKFLLNAVVPRDNPDDFVVVDGASGCQNDRVTDNAVEVTALVDGGDEGGDLTFNVSIQEDEPGVDLSGFDPILLEGLRATPTAIQLEITKDGHRHRIPLSGTAHFKGFYRYGSCKITGKYATEGGGLGFQWWLTTYAHSKQVDLILNVHNGIPGPPVWFDSMRLLTPDGWTWRPMLHDPCMGDGFLVKPHGRNVFPQRMERSFRVCFFPEHELEGWYDRHPINGWGVADWHKHYLPQGTALPKDIDRVGTIVNRFNRAQGRLANNQASEPGDSPWAPLWPGEGVRYGGMTGGVDIWQTPGATEALAPVPESIKLMWLKQLRYRSRQKGCIYKRNGDPDYRSDAKMFNSQFLRDSDDPWNWDRWSDVSTGWDPIDSQHYIRAMKDSLALAWLTNDPLSKLYLRMDSNITRMSFSNRLPSSPGKGGGGRAEGWAGVLVCASYQLDGGEGRLKWIADYALNYATRMMPSGMLPATNLYKIAEDPPFNSRFWAGRSNEHIYMMHGLKACAVSLGPAGLALASTLEKGLQALSDYAWGGGATYRKYVAGPNDGSGHRYASKDEWPPDLNMSAVGTDGYQCGNVPGLAWYCGLFLRDILLDYCNKDSVEEARQWFVAQAHSTDNLENIALSVAALQRGAEI